MAQGALTLFQQFSEDISDTFALGDDTFKLGLITTIPTAADATPAWADYTEVSPIGTSYVAGGATLTTAWGPQSSGTCYWDATGAPAVTWSQDAGGPTNIKGGLIYASSAVTPTNTAVCFIDMTTDGSTAISLVTGDITWTPHANGMFGLS